MLFQSEAALLARVAKLCCILRTLAYRQIVLGKMSNLACGKRGGDVVFLENLQASRASNKAPPLNLALCSRAATSVQVNKWTK